MELKRKFYGFLKAWKSNHKQECLLVKGARQIGKTYLVEKLGREEYESFIEFNFILDPTACGIFDGSLKAEDLQVKISAFIGSQRLIPGKTLIFLDEIQECPNARTALKSFALDGRYDVIASGSLLGIKYRSKKRREKAEPKSIAVGYERQVTMHSLDFEEFLWAKGIGPEVIESLKGCFCRREMVPPVLNDRLGGYLREYMLGILAKGNRKFKYSEVEKNGGERKFGESIEWLKDAALAPMCENVVVPEVPLSANVRDGWFKLYLSDIGLLSALYGLETKGLLFSGRLVGNAKGGLYENLIAGMLERNGYPLRYYKTVDGTREVEFVIEKDGGVVPIEVKSSNGATVSLNETLGMHGVPYGYKFVEGNVGVSGNKITLPHFMAMFL